VAPSHTGDEEFDSAMLSNSFLGTSELSERQITDEIEWVITGVWDNTFNGAVRAQLSEHIVWNPYSVFKD
jgi:hypothetical protein